MSILDKLLGDRANKHVGLLAEFSNPGELVHAVEEVRREGYTRIDTFTPFPVHGMDAAMGLSPSKLGYIVIGGGITGFILAMLMQWYMGAGPQADWVWTELQGYPIPISGKPFFAIEPSIPIAFELTVLLSALGAVVGMIVLNGLPKPYNPLFYSERFQRATDDGFFLHVAAADGSYDDSATAGLLRDLGAVHVEYISHDGAYDVNADGTRVQTVAAPPPPPPRVSAH